MSTIEPEPYAYYVLNSKRRRLNHNMYMIVGGQRSNNITWNYQLPKVRSTPNPIDAISGGDVIIEGSNFGIEENDIEIYVGNYSCSDSRREVDPDSKDPKFTCRLSNMNARVGYTSVYVRASKQIIYIVCKKNDGIHMPL